MFGKLYKFHTLLTMAFQLKRSLSVQILNFSTQADVRPTNAERHTECIWAQREIEGQFYFFLKLIFS